MNQHVWKIIAQAAAAVVLALLGKWLSTKERSKGE